MKALLFLIFNLVVLFSYSQNPVWIKLDKKLINKVADKCDSIDELEAYFSKKNKDEQKEYLGFNYWLKSTSLGAGYISIHCDFYYLNDSLVSYVLTPTIPLDIKHQKYFKWYQ